MAGGSEDPADARFVNPCQVEEMAPAVDAARTMQRAVRERRHRELVADIRRSDVTTRRRTCLDVRRRVKRPVTVP